MKLRPFQETCVAQMLSFLAFKGAVYNACEMGCISGEAIIRINRKGHCLSYSLKQAYSLFKKWKGSQCQTRSWAGDEDIRLNGIVDVIYRGKSETVTIKTDTKNLRLTLDHLVYTERGWIKAGNLVLGEKIATDPIRSKSKRILKPKLRYNLLQVSLDYPQGHLVTQRGKKVRKREKHILFAEAYLNDMSPFDYIYKFLPTAPSGAYKYIDSSVFHVHHRNGDIKDNNKENLEVLTVSEHAKLHAFLGKTKHFNQGIHWEILLSVHTFGHEDVYDLVMKDPHRNFCPNGIVVHNCGKSAMTIACAEKLNLNKVIVICPAVVTNVWRAELLKWRAHLGWEIHSYGMAVGKFFDYIKDRDWELLILDEAHYLKNPKAKRTKAILDHLWPKARYRICLSGTPMTQSVADCWTLFSRIMPEFGTYWDFAAQYTKLQETPWGTKPTGIRNAEELKQIIRSNFFIRYTKAEVLPELPPKTWQKIPLDRKYVVEFSPAERKQNELYIKAMKEFFIKGTPVREQPPKQIATWRKEQGLKKLPVVIKFCKELLEQEIPIVVFTYHREVHAKIKEALAEYKPASIQGGDSVSKKQAALDDFTEGRSNILLSNIEAGGIGITAVRGSTVIFAELDWSPAKVSQAVDRTHRINQLKAVTVYYFSCDGSIEEDLMDALVEKLRSFIEVLN